MGYNSRLDAAKDLRRFNEINIGEHMFLRFDNESKKFEIEEINPNNPDDPENVPTIQDMPGAWKKVLNIIRRHYDRFPLVYVNAYAVSRHCVHPAEGGIWEDFGEPLASVPVYKGKDDIEAVKKKLRDMFGPEYELNRHRSSVLGGQNFEIYIEDHMAEHFPKEPYVYE